MSKKINNLLVRVNDQKEKLTTFTAELEEQEETFANEKVTKYAYVCKSKTFERNIKKAEEEIIKLEKMLEQEENKSLVKSEVDSVISEKELPKTNVKTNVNQTKPKPKLPPKNNDKPDNQASSNLTGFDNFDIDIKTPTRTSGQKTSSTEPRQKNSEKQITTNKNDRITNNRPPPLFHKKNMVDNQTSQKVIGTNPIDSVLKTPTRTPLNEKSKKGMKDDTKSPLNKSVSFDDNSTTPQAVNKNRKGVRDLSVSPITNESIDKKDNSQNNQEIMAIVSELKLTCEKRIKNLEFDNRFFKKKLEVFDANKEIDDEKIAGLEKHNATLQDRIKKLEIAQNKLKQQTPEINDEKLLIIEEKFDIVEKKVDQVQDSMKFLQDTQNKKILSLQSDFDILQEYIQAENDKKHEIEERLNGIENEHFEMATRIKEMQDNLLNLSRSDFINNISNADPEGKNTSGEGNVNAEQMLNAVVELRNNNDSIVQQFDKFEKEIEVQIIKIKDEVVDSNRKIKAMMPLQFELVQKNSDLLAYNEKLNKKLVRLKEHMSIQENSFMKQIVPEMNLKVRDLRYEISKSHDFLNYGLTSIEKIYEELSENDSIIKKYQPKNQTENEKFNQRLFECDDKSQMKVYTYKGDTISFEALPRAKDCDSKSQITASVKTHDNLNLFVGTTNGCLEQYSLHKPKQIKNYSQVLESEICLMQCSVDNLSLFATDTKGSIIKWSIPEQREHKFLDRIHDCQITKMALTNDNSYLLTCDLKCGLKQFSVSDFELVKIYDKIFGESLEHENGVSFFEVTSDSKSLIVCDSSKKQIYLISLINQKFEYDYSEGIAEVHPNGVDCLCLVNNTMFVGSKLGVVTEISISSQQVMNNYTTELENGIYTILPSVERNLLFISDNAGNLIEWSIERQKTTKYYGRAHSVYIDFMTLSNDENYLITKDEDSCIKYWHIESQSIGQNVGYPSDDKVISIFSIKK